MYSSQSSLNGCKYVFRNIEYKTDKSYWLEFLAYRLLYFLGNPEVPGWGHLTGLCFTGFSGNVCHMHPLRLCQVHCFAGCYRYWFLPMGIVFRARLPSD